MILKDCFLRLIPRGAPPVHTGRTDGRTDEKSLEKQDVTMYMFYFLSFSLVFLGAPWGTSLSGRTDGRKKLGKTIFYIMFLYFPSFSLVLPCGFHGCKILFFPTFFVRPFRVVRRGPTGDKFSLGPHGFFLIFLLILGGDFWSCFGCVFIVLNPVLEVFVGGFLEDFSCIF